ncbi:hypothetical protein E2I00_013645, partial [Balaenoptera physalus]
MLVVKCEPPPAISNGKHNGGDEDLYTYGSSVTYSCDPGFSMLGKASISCTVENKTIGVWNPSPPTCKNVVCHRPQVPNGIIVSGFGPTYNYKNFLVFSCKKGYVLKGSHLIRCEANNKWHPSPPICELNSCIGLPDIPHAVWNRRGYELSNQEVFAVGTALKYQCKHGYRPIPDEPLTVTCQENFTWTPSEGCERVCCPTPELETVRNTSERTDFPDRCEYAYGHSVSYTCDEGYYPVSPDGMSSCQADGTWKPEMPACKQAMCLKPEIENGTLSVDKEKYVASENVTVQCDSGFSLFGPQDITCSENTTWHPTVPTCHWEVPEVCEQAPTGRHLRQCLPSPQNVEMALELYKLSLKTRCLLLEELPLQPDSGHLRTLSFSVVSLRFFTMSPKLQGIFPALCLLGVLSLLHCPLVLC